MHTVSYPSLLPQAHCTSRSTPFSSFFLLSGRLLNSTLQTAPSNAYKCTRQTFGYLSFNFRKACSAPERTSSSAEPIPMESKLNLWCLCQLLHCLFLRCHKEKVFPLVRLIDKIFQRLTGITRILTINSLIIYAVFCPWPSPWQARRSVYPVSVSPASEALQYLPP